MQFMLAGVDLGAHLADARDAALLLIGYNPHHRTSFRMNKYRPW
jgi:hypothetical protein